MSLTKFHIKSNVILLKNNNNENNDKNDIDGSEIENYGSNEKLRAIVRYTASTMVSLLLPLLRNPLICDTVFSCVVGMCNSIENQLLVGGARDLADSLRISATISLRWVWVVIRVMINFCLVIVCLLVYMFVCLFFCLYIRLLFCFICKFLLYIYFYLCLPLCMFICLIVFLSFYLYLKIFCSLLLLLLFFSLFFSLFFHLADL